MNLFKLFYCLALLRLSISLPIHFPFREWVGRTEQLLEWGGPEWSAAGCERGCRPVWTGSRWSRTETPSPRGTERSKKIRLGWLFSWLPKNSLHWCRTRPWQNGLPSRPVRGPSSVRSGRFQERAVLACSQIPPWRGSRPRPARVENKSGNWREEK